MKELIGKKVKLNDLDSGQNEARTQEETIISVYEAQNAAGVFVITETSMQYGNGFWIGYAKASRIAVGSDPNGVLK